MRLSTLTLALAATFSAASYAEQAELSELEQLKQELQAIKDKLAKTEELIARSEEILAKTQEKAAKTEEKVTKNEEVLAKNEAEKANQVKVGGAVRFQYGVKDYDADDRDRVGDFDFDVFRLDFNGNAGDIIFSAQYRWYQYMDTIHHAYLGYQFNEHWQGQVGISQVPFGNLTWNSNSFFFSTAFYVGLEDDYDAGLKFMGRYDNHDIQLAFYKTDELGGIDGFVSDRTSRYSYDIVGARSAGEGTFDAPGTALAEDSTINARYSYHFDHAEVGVSLMSGDIEGTAGSAGDRSAYAFHVKGQLDNFGLLLQYTDYEYDLDDGTELLTVGAYSFYDTIPTEATLYNMSLTYSMDVNWGPVSNLKFYNDYSLMTDKSGGLTEDTFMNVLGVQVTSGNLYTLIDLASGKNQPFIGGSLAGEADDTNTRLNINFGYYF